MFQAFLAVGGYFRNTMILPQRRGQNKAPRPLSRGIGPLGFARGQPKGKLFPAFSGVNYPFGADNQRAETAEFPPKQRRKALKNGLSRE
ncbi:MAG: hypothetical protein IIZ25_07755 [Thermoguttaceae bacterium]|nr:hypothetical protein [Thermoguttaceae bacterium]